MEIRSFLEPFPVRATGGEVFPIYMIFSSKSQKYTYLCTLPSIWEDMESHPQIWAPLWIGGGSTWPSYSDPPISECNYKYRAPPGHLFFWPIGKMRLQKKVGSKFSDFRSQQFQISDFKNFRSQISKISDFEVEIFDENFRDFEIFDENFRNSWSEFLTSKKYFIDRDFFMKIDIFKKYPL